MKCSLCEKETSTVMNYSGHRLCTTCRYILTGITMLPGIKSRGEIETKDGMTIWVKDDGTCESVWRNGVRIPVNKRLAPTDIILFLRSNPITKWCSHCGMVVSEYAGVHFSGSFCKVCWEVYKEKNSRKCGLCGMPMYKCYC
jgi:hypothetical protein